MWTENDIFQNFATLVFSTQESVGPEIFVGDSPRPKLSEKVYIVGAILYPSTTSRRSFFLIEKKLFDTAGRRPPLKSDFYMQCILWNTRNMLRMCDYNTAAKRG